MEIEFVVEFQADLLDARKLGPAEFYNVVERTPAFLVVEFTSGFGTDAPDVVECLEALKLFRGLEFLDGSDAPLLGRVGRRVVPFVKEGRCFTIAAGESKNGGGGCNLIWVGDYSCYGGGICANANIVKREDSRELDGLKLIYKERVGRVEAMRTVDGESKLVKSSESINVEEQQRGNETPHLLTNITRLHLILNRLFPIIL